MARQWPIDKGEVNPSARFAGLEMTCTLHLRRRRPCDYLPIVPDHPKSPKETTSGMKYFARMLDKIRMNARGDLAEDYLSSLGHQKRMDGVCSNFLRIRYADLRDRVLAGGDDEEILEWCYTNGRRLNEGDLVVWNAFISKLGWNDFATPRLERRKNESGVAHRTDIATLSDLIDWDEKRIT